MDELIQSPSISIKFPQKEYLKTHLILIMMCLKKNSLLFRNIGLKSKKHHEGENKIIFFLMGIHSLNGYTKRN